jgi:hypothetical protein
MPQDNKNDLQPPMPYKVRQAARPLSQGEIKAAADRAEARAARTKLVEDQARFSATKPPWDC